MSDKQENKKFLYIGIGVFFLLVLSSTSAESVVPTILLFTSIYFGYKWRKVLTIGQKIEEERDKCKELVIKYENNYRGLIDIDEVIEERNHELAQLQQKKDSSKNKLDELQKIVGRYEDLLDINTSINKGNENLVKLQENMSKHESLIDIDKAIEESNNELDRIREEKELQQKKCDDLKSTINKYTKKIAFYEDKLDVIDFGLYEPHFAFEHSETYKEKIKEIRSKQKELFKESLAIKCTTDITVNGNQRKGRTFANKIIKLTGRAFNKECDVAVANVNWKNISKMEKRIESSFEALNKINQGNHIVITNSYLKLKLDELRLAYEYQVKKQAEREEQAEIRRKEREEKKLLQEAKKIQAEEDKLQELLTKVQAQANTSSGEELEKLQEEVNRLGGELKSIQSENSRVKAMAEQTKLGYVYVISNIGSFGENMFKIGMTRRLDPNDRIRELGSASVPFYFDTHAIIFSEDAPALEAELQKAFDDKRVNRVNSRKEYFNVTLDEIKKKVWEINPDVEFVDEAEAKEYRESLSLQERHKFSLEDNTNSFDDEDDIDL